MMPILKFLGEKDKKIKRKEKAIECCHVGRQNLYRTYLMLSNLCELKTEDYVDKNRTYLV